MGRSVKEALAEIGEVRAKHSQNLTAMGVWRIFWDNKYYPCAPDTKDEMVFTLRHSEGNRELCEIYLSNGERLCRGVYCSRFVLVRSDKTLEDFL